MARFLFIDIDKEFNIILSEKKKEVFKILKTAKINRAQPSRIKAELNSGASWLKAPLCYMSLPASMFGYRIIELPFKEENKIREVLPFELKEKIMERIEDIVYDFVILPSDNNTQKVLAVYTGKDELSGLIKIFSEAGIEPDVIGSLSLRDIIDKGFKAEALLNPPEYESHLLELLKKEAERPVINLRRGLGLSIEREALLKKTKITNILLLCIALILSLSFGISIRRNYSEASKIIKWINDEYRKEFLGEKIKDELLQLKSHLKEAKDKRDILMGIPVLETLKKIKPGEGIIIESVDMDTRGITLKGESRQLSGIEAFKEKLRENFKNPSIVESGQFSGNIRFTIKAER
ncbi:MAG: hypothetical protein ACK4TF_07065 [Thermodesulfovibrionales bacterium]